jgi:hypothetical protein
MILCQKIIFFPIFVGHHYTQTNTNNVNMIWALLQTAGSKNIVFKQKHNTLCVGHHYMHTNTNNVNTTWALLLTTGSKDIVFKRKSWQTPQHGTQNTKTHNRLTQKTKNMSNTGSFVISICFKSCNFLLLDLWFSFLWWMFCAVLCLFVTRLTRWCH